MNQTSYVPILKAKMGEFLALEDLADDAKRLLMPLLEVTPLSEFDESGKTVDDLVADLVPRIAEKWGADQAFFVDGFLVEEATMKDGGEPIAALLARCREAKLKAVPVTGLRRVREYQQAVAAAVAADGRGLCLRLTSDDLSDTEDMAAEIQAAMKWFKLPIAQTDLMIDYGPITEEIRKTIQVAIVAQINALPFLSEWRSLIFAASAFPVDLSHLDRQTLSMLPRSEWSIWRHMRGKPALKRMPTYGDYAIAHPTSVDIDPRLMRMSPNIRYTHAEAWIVAKGSALPRKSDTKKNPPSKEQYPALCRALTKSDYWIAPTYSWGAEFIDLCGQGKGATGNATTWRRVGTGHHLATVLRQLASLPAS